MGYDLIDMIGKKSFGDLVYLLFTGDLPRGNEGKMVEAILVSSCEHGLATPSTNAARSVASGGVPLQAAVAAGIVCLGDYHGGAIEQCAKILQENISDAEQHGFEETAARLIALRPEYVPTITAGAAAGQGGRSLFHPGPVTAAVPAVYQRCRERDWVDPLRPPAVG